MQARRIGENLSAIGCFMVPTFAPELAAVFTDAEIRMLAQLEYGRLIDERIAERQANSSEHHHDDAVPLPWDDLPEKGRIRYLRTVRSIPDAVDRAGFQVLRSTPDNPTC